MLHESKKKIIFLQLPLSLPQPGQPALLPLDGLTEPTDTDVAFL